MRLDLKKDIVTQVTTAAQTVDTLAKTARAKHGIESDFILTFIELKDSKKDSHPLDPNQYPWLNAEWEIMKLTTPTATFEESIAAFEASATMRFNAMIKIKIVQASINISLKNAKHGAEIATILKNVSF